MPYRNKTSQPFAEFTLRERGIADYPDLTVEVETSFSEKFVEMLKQQLRHRAERGWDPENKRWRIHPTVLQTAIDIAFLCFPNVYKVEGEKVTDLVNNTSFENQSLFS